VAVSGPRGAHVSGPHPTADGEYRVGWLAEAEGLYTLTISCADVHVLGSPYVVWAGEEAASAARGPLYPRGMLDLRLRDPASGAAAGGRRRESAALPLAERIGHLAVSSPAALRKGLAAGATESDTRPAQGLSQSHDPHQA